MCAKHLTLPPDHLRHTRCNLPRASCRPPTTPTAAGVAGSRRTKCSHPVLLLLLLLLTRRTVPARGHRNLRAAVLLLLLLLPAWRSAEVQCRRPTLLLLVLLRPVNVADTVSPSAAHPAPPTAVLFAHTQPTRYTCSYFSEYRRVAFTDVVLRSSSYSYSSSYSKA